MDHFFPHICMAKNDLFAGARFLCVNVLESRIVTPPYHDHLLLNTGHHGQTKKNIRQETRITIVVLSERGLKKRLPGTRHR